MDATTPTKRSPRRLPPDASRRSTQLLRRAMVSQSITSAALEIPKVSDTLKGVVFSDHVAGRTGLRSLLSEMEPTESVDPVRDFNKIAESIARQTAVNAEMVIAAAVIILSHSTADDIFTGACDLAMDLEPEAWISELNMERKVSLSLLKDKGADGVFALELERFKKMLPGKSLPNRAELLFRHVKIRHNEKLYRPGDVEYFELSKLKDADDLRNSIVHGSGLPQIDLGRSKNTMLFLHEAAVAAMRSLAHAYAIPLDWTIFMGAKPT